MQCNTVNCVTEPAQLLGLELSIDWATTDITTDTSHHTDRRVTGRVRVYLDYRGEGGDTFYSATAGNWNFIAFVCESKLCMEEMHA